MGGKRTKPLKMAVGLKLYVKLLMRKSLKYPIIIIDKVNLYLLHWVYAVVYRIFPNGHLENLLGFPGL